MKTLASLRSVLAWGVLGLALASPAAAQTSAASPPPAPSDEAARALVSELTRSSRCSGATVFTDLRQRLARGDVAAPDAGRALAILVNDETVCPALRTAANALQETYPPPPSPAPVPLTTASPAAGQVVADSAPILVAPPPPTEPELTSPSDFVVGPPPRNLTREQRS